MHFFFAVFLGGWELIIVVSVILLLFGAKQIPKLGRNLGEGIKEFKKSARELPNTDPKLDEIQKASSDNKAQFMSQQTSTSFPGLDVSTYPSDPTMIDLITNTNLHWCGYYLAPAPNHPSTDWMGKRGNLSGAGWGFAPIYVGEQQGSINLTPVKGGNDGVDAVNLATAEGFPPNSVIYLDVESGGPIVQAMFDYVAAWQTAVANSGYRPGIYCSYLVADQFKVNAVVPKLYFWVFRMIDQGSNNGAYTAPFPTQDPTSCGFAYAINWQYAQGQFGTSIAWTSGQMSNVDLDVSTVPDPSLPI